MLPRSNKNKENFKHLHVIENLIVYDIGQRYNRNIFPSLIVDGKIIATSLELRGLWRLSLWF